MHAQIRTEHYRLCIWCFICYMLIFLWTSWAKPNPRSISICSFDCPLQHDDFTVIKFAMSVYHLPAATLSRCWSNPLWPSDVYIYIYNIYIYTSQLMASKPGMTGDIPYISGVFHMSHEKMSPSHYTYYTGWIVRIPHIWPGSIIPYNRSTLPQCTFGHVAETARAGNSWWTGIRKWAKLKTDV